MSKGDGGEAIGAVIVAIGAAVATLLGLKLLSDLSRTKPPRQYKCPVCGNIIQRGIKICPYCYSEIKWS